MSESKIKKQVAEKKAVAEITTEIVAEKPTSVTSLDEIRAQLAGQIISIPGFKPDTEINVKIRPVDLTTYILKTNITNPLLAIAVQKVKDGKTPEEIEKDLREKLAKGDVDFSAMMPAIDAVVEEALVEPTFQQISEIAPLTLFQKMAIMDAAVGDVTGLISFRK